MTAVLVVATAKQRGGVIQPCRVQRREVFRQAVDFLIDIRLQQVADTARRKLMIHFTGLNKEIAVQRLAAPDILRQRRHQR